MPVNDAEPQDLSPDDIDSSFSAFIMSLATSALMHMGEVYEGALADEPIKADLGMAKQTIDIIGMLYHKTRGNLSPGETRVIEVALYDLRMRFLKAQQK